MGEAGGERQGGEEDGRAWDYVAGGGGDMRSGIKIKTISKTVRVEYA